MSLNVGVGVGVRLIKPVKLYMYMLNTQLAPRYYDGMKQNICAFVHRPCVRMCMFVCMYVCMYGAVIRKLSGTCTYVFLGRNEKEEMIKRALYITMFFLLQLLPSNKKKKK